MSAPYRLAVSIVRCAATCAPSDRRQRMAREWEAELERAFADGGGWSVTWSALGAFADAWALRRLARSKDRRIPFVERARVGLQDARVAARALRRSPGFTAASVLTLAIGIGGVVAIYTLVDRVVLDPLPYPEPERLVRLENQVPGVAPGERWDLSTAQWVHFTDLSDTMDEVALYQRGIGGTIMTAEGAARIQGIRATASTLVLLGARAEVGRLFGEMDDRPGADPVMVLSHQLWAQGFGEDPDVVGTSLTIDGTPVEVIGVANPDLEVPGTPRGSAPDFWVPLRVDRGGYFGNNHVFAGLGRLAADASPEAVEEELGRLTARLPEAFPDAYSQGFFDRYGFRTIATPLASWVSGDLARNLWILLAGVGLVLVMACANVANLFAVRSEGRRRELAVRAALGAGRASLARYVFAEGLVLAAMGGTLGAALAFWSVGLGTRFVPSDLPRLGDAAVGLGGALLAMLLSFAIAIAIAALAFLAATRHGIAVGAGAGGRTAGAGPGRQRVRSVLVITQVALALTLSVGAGLLINGFRELTSADVGFDPDGVMAMSVYLDSDRYPTDTDLWNAYRMLEERVASIPGVVSVGHGEGVPIDNPYGCTVQAFEDESVYARVEAAGSTPCAGQIRVTPGYFESLGIPILEGRALESGDMDDPTRGSVVVSRAFADRFWPGESALGRGINPSGRTTPPFYRVIGVTGDVPRAVEGGERPFAQNAIAAYYPVVHNPAPEGNWGFWWPGSIALIVRAEAGSATTLLPAIRSAVWEVDSGIPISNARDMEAVVAAAVADVGFVSLLLGIAAILALILAAVGLYGVISYIVSCRTKEIGVRLAVGARRSEVEAMVLSRTAVLVALGVLAGIPLAYVAARLARSVLVGVETMTPLPYLLAAVGLGVAAGVASWLPARRAGTVSPVDALRSD